MSKVRDISNLSNVIRTDASGNVSFVSGSTTLATLNTSGQLSGSSPVLSSSYALNATSASYAANAVTASFANAFTVAGTLTAQTLVVQTITSSVDFVTGSTRFGSILGNTHVFSGSVTMNPGGLFVSSSGNVGIGTSTLNSKFIVVDNNVPNASGNIISGTQFAASIAGGYASLNIGAYDDTSANRYGYIRSAFSDSAATPAEMRFYTGATVKMTIASGGNVGIGVTTANWDSTIKLIEIGNKGTFYGGYNGNIPVTYIGNNAYYNGGWLYANTNAYKALLLDCGDGNYHFQNAAAGTAGDGITWSSLMKITSAGNVGIGTSFVISPYLVGSQTSGVLQVATNVAKTATTNSYPVGFFGSNDATYPLGLYIGILTGATTATRQVKLQGTEIGVSPNAIVMQADGGNVVIGTTADSGRKLQVESTSTPLLLHNSNNVSGVFCNIWQLGGSNTNNNSSYYIYCDTDYVGVRMVVYGNGNLANVNNSYGAYSDIKLKENIVDATPKLDDLLKVKIRNFNLKGSDIKQIGVVAQELEEIFPSMIEESNDTIKDEDGKYIKTGEKTKTVKYSVFVPMLIKAIQEQQVQINELKAQING